jgi:hypothetical protein
MVLTLSTGLGHRVSYGQNETIYLIADDAYAVGMVYGPFANPTGRGVRVLLFVDSVTTGNGATATAVLTADAVTSITVDTGGEGYASAPTVVITNAEGDVTGSGATATATLTGDVVTSIAVDTGGTGYTAPPIISFTGGGTEGDLKVRIEMEEYGSETRFTLLESAAITALGLATPLTVYPGLPAVANVTASNHVGPDFYIRMVHSAAGLWRYNMTVQLLA